MAPKKAKAASKKSKTAKTAKTATGPKTSKVSKTAKTSKASKSSKSAKATTASSANESSEEHEESEEQEEPEGPEYLGKYNEKRKFADDSFVSEIPEKKGKFGVDDLSGGDMQDVVVDMEGLMADLSHSYVLELAEFVAEYEKKHPPPSLPERATWTYNGPLPLNDPNNLPEGWIWGEPDLDKHDIDAQIQRCHERIEEQILPWYFEHQLKGYQDQKDRQVKMQALERGNYSLDVLERISNLKFIENDLQTRGDEFKQLVNVKALLQAYRSHTLDWIDGLVTYWSRGKQLCEPRPLYWAEFEAINREHKGYESFWVEGVNGPGPSRAKASLTVPMNREGWTFHAGVRLTNAKGPNAVQPPGQAAGTKAVRISTKRTAKNAAGLRDIPAAGLAHYPWWTSLEFIYDTGADLMIIHRSDVDLMKGPWEPPHVSLPMVTGCTTLTMASGASSSYDCILVQACLLDPATPNPNGSRLTQWIYSMACVLPGTNLDPTRTARLDGPWLRKALYQAIQPEGTFPLRFSNTKGGLNLTAGSVPPQVAAVDTGDWPPFNDRLQRLIPLPAGAPPPVAKVAPDRADNRVPL